MKPEIIAACALSLVCATNASLLYRAHAAKLEDDAKAIESYCAKPYASESLCYNMSASYRAAHPSSNIQAELLALRNGASPGVIAQGN